MNLVFIAGIAVFYLVTIGLAKGCARLREKK